jgi:hypothetical protein
VAVSVNTAAWQTVLKKHGKVMVFLDFIEDSLFFFMDQFQKAVSGKNIQLVSLLNQSICMSEYFRFGAFEEFKRLLVNEKGQLTPSTRLLAGLGAGVSEAS